jgi:hypothetical protein
VTGLAALCDDATRSISQPDNVMIITVQYLVERGWTGASDTVLGGLGQTPYVFRPTFCAISGYASYLPVGGPSTRYRVFRIYPASGRWVSDTDSGEMQNCQ